MLTEHDCIIAPSTYYAFNTPRSVRDAELKERITEVYRANFRVYGARKIWRELNHRGQKVARCTLEPLMRDLGLTRAVRDERVVTTVADASGAPGAGRGRPRLRRQCAEPLLGRGLHAHGRIRRPGLRRVRRGRPLPPHHRLVRRDHQGGTVALDALEMALWQRDRDQRPVIPGELVHRSDAGGQYTSFRLAEHR